MTPAEQKEMDSLRQRLRGHEQLAAKGIYLTTEEYTRRVKATAALAAALERTVLAFQSLMPGLRHISVNDYALLNDAPSEAEKALKDYHGLGPDMPVR